MSLASWQPPPTPYGGLSHTSNSDYGRWSNLTNPGFSTVTLTAPPSPPWSSAKTKYSGLDHNSSSIYPNGIQSYGSYSKPTTPSSITNITLSGNSTLASTLGGNNSTFNGNSTLASTLGGNNSTFNGNSTLASTLGGNNSTFNSNTGNLGSTNSFSTPPDLKKSTAYHTHNGTSSSNYSPELYKETSSIASPFKSNHYSTLDKSKISTWRQGTSEFDFPSPPKEANLGFRSLGNNHSTSTGGHHSALTDPGTNRGYELYTDAIRPATTEASPSTEAAKDYLQDLKNHALQRSRSFHGTTSSTNSPYSNPVTSRIVQDKLDSWGNERQNASVANTTSQYTFRDSTVNSVPTSNGPDPLASTTRNIPWLYGSRGPRTQGYTTGPPDSRESLSNTSSGLEYRSTTPKTYESFNNGMGLSSRPTSGKVNGYGQDTTDRTPVDLRLNLEDLSLSRSSTASSLATRLTTPESPKAQLAPLNGLSPRYDSEWDRIMNNNNTVKVNREFVINTHNGSSGTSPRAVEYRFRSAGARQPKSILKKKSAYDTVSGGENWKSYFQENNNQAFGLYRQNTMPNLRGTSRAPLPQLARRTSGKRVTFAV